MKISDKEILDFVKENITIAKDTTGHIEIKEVLCSIRGNVIGDVGGDVRGNVEGSVKGYVACDVESYVGGGCWRC